MSEIRGRLAASMAFDDATFHSVMYTAAATFTAPADGPASAVAGLATIGFEFGRPHAVSRTLLDTFDGRLHGAGLRLELRECDGLGLVLSGAGAVPAHLTVSSPPRFPDELPPGPFRTRLAAVVDVRALLPVLCVTALQTDATWFDRARKAVATATLSEHFAVDGHDVDFVAWTIEIAELRGYAKFASRAGDLLERLGLLRLGEDTLTGVAAAVGIELAGFSGAPTIPLDPEMPAIDGLRAVFVNLAGTIAANWQGTLDRIDTEFLHDLRVSVRRTRTVLGQGRSVLPAAIVERTAERFAWLAALTGPARDLDVYLIEWNGYTRQLDADVIVALEPVRAVLGRRREAAHAALAQAMRSAEADELMTTWRTWLHDPTLADPQGAQADRPLGRVVAKRIARAQVNLIERGRLIRPDTPAEHVHDLRKDAKKLRYLLECFGSLLPDGPRKTFVRRLKDFQDNLGEHQDAEVHVAELRGIADELHLSGASSDTMLAIGQLSERLDQRRIAARADFAERFAAYDTEATQGTLDAALHGMAR